METSTATTESVPALARVPGASARRRGTRPSGADRLTVVLFTVAAFLVVLALLAGQLRSSAGQPSARRVVVVRKVYRTTVVETDIGAAGGGSSVTQSVSSSGSATALASGPTTRSS